jgi:hypothetical protein
MPGHFYLLAGAFSLFGYSPLIARLPCLASYVVCAVGVFLIGRKLYGRGAGFVAAALFMTFPLMGFFAFSALADLTVTAAVVVSFAVFVYLPEQARFWAVPFLLILPFLFRETTALVVMPMSILALSPWSDRRWLRFGFASAGSVVTLSIVNAWQISLGKEPTPLSWVTRGSFNYADATLNASPSLTFAEWISGFASNIASNLEQLTHRYATQAFATPEPLSTAAIVAGAVALWIWGSRRRGSDLFPIGAALLTTVILSLVVVAYSVYGFRLFRTALFTVPLLAVGLGGLVSAGGARILRRSGRSISSRAALSYFVAFVSVLGSLGMWMSANTIYTYDRSQIADAIERLAPPDDAVIVSELWVAYDYLLEHYPVRYAFPPLNEETLRLLCAHHPIGLVISQPYDLFDRLPPSELAALGFVRDPRVLRVRRTPLTIFMTQDDPPNDRPCSRKAHESLE